MTIEYGQGEGESQQQQQGGRADDLQHRYRAIGIPALNAAAAMARRPRADQARQQQATIFDYED